MAINNIALAGRMLLKWMPRILVTTVSIMLNREYDKREISIKGMNI